MKNKRLKQKIAALSVTGALIPFSLSAVPAMAAEQVAVQPNPVTGVTLNQSSVQKIAEHVGSHLADSPVLKVVNQTPKTPVTKKEEEKQETQDVSLQSALSSHSSQPLQEQRTPEGEAKVQTTSAPEESSTSSALNSSPSTPTESAGSVQTINQYLLNRAAQGDPQLMTSPSPEETAGSSQTPQNSANPSPLTNDIPNLTENSAEQETPDSPFSAAGALLGIPTAIGTAALGAAGIEAGTLGATVTGLGILGTAALAVNALPAAALLGVGTLGAAALGTGAALLGAGIAGTAIVGTGAALLAAPVVGATAIGAGVLGLGALAVATPAAIAAVSVPVILGATVGAGALLVGQAVAIGTLAVGTVGLALGAGAITLGAVATGAVVLGAAALGATTLAAIAGTALFLGTQAVLGLGALTLFNLALGTAIGLGAITAGILGLGTLAALAAAPVLIGLAVVGTAIALPILTALAVGTLGLLGLANLGLMGLNALLIGGTILLGAVTLGAILLFAPGAILLALAIGPMLLAGHVLLQLFAIPLSTLTWANIGRAWGRFVGSIMGASVAAVISGILGWLIGPPGMKALFFALWECICVPLWAFLGAFNGALICTPIGALLGLNLGVLFPLWSIAIGSWLVPMFALLWDSLTGIIQFESLKRSLAAWVSTWNWMNIGRAWGRFVGSFLAGTASFVIAGVLGALVGALLGGWIGSLFGQTTPGAVIGALLLAPLWQILLVPLWTMLGALNGALVCMPLGTALGTGLGAAFPLWSLSLGLFIVPACALLWDSLATGNELITHLISWGIQWIPRYLLRWTRYNLFTEIPAILKSLFNLVTLQYGPLTNHIHKITSFSDSVDSGWGSPLYMLYGKTVVAGLPVLDSAPWLVGYALGAWVNQYALPGGRTNEILFLLDPFYIPDYNLRNQLEYLSNGSLNFWKLFVMRFFARLSVRTSQVVMINVGSNDLWVPFMAALYDIADDGRLPFDLLTDTERGAIFGAIPAMMDNVFSYIRAWIFHPWKWGLYTIKLLSGGLKEFTDYFINLPLILLHIFLLNPFATVVVEGTESPVRNWDLIPGADDNLVEYLMEPVYAIQNLYKRLCTILYPGNWLLFLPTSKAVYADMHGIQLKGERTTIPTFESLSLDGFGFDPHPSWIGRRQQADRVLKALGQPSPYSIWESAYLRPSIFWNVIYPYRPTSFIHPLINRIRPLDGIKLRSPINMQTILPSVTGALYPINY